MMARHDAGGWSYTLEDTQALMSGLQTDQVPGDVWFLLELRTIWVLDSPNTISFPPPPAPGDFLPHLKYLKLENTGIFAIPDAVWSGMPNLETLALLGNPITERTLRSAFKNLPKLKDLSVSGNRLAVIPEEIWDLQKLQYLIIQNTPNVVRFPEPPQSSTVALWPFMSTLELSQTGITEISSSVWENMPYLDALQIERTLVSTTTLQNLFGHLPLLDQLRISATGVQSIPGSIGNLTNLMRLELFDGAFKRLPRSFCRLSSLAHLYISGNPEFESLPRCIGELSNLETLELRDLPKLRGIPKSIGNAIYLEVLIIDNTSVRTLPEESIGSLRNLKELFVRNSKLERVPSTLDQRMASLVMISFSGNPDLKRLPENIGDIPDLDFLNISRTGVEYLPASLTRTRFLTIEAEETPMASSISEGEGSQLVRTTVAHPDYDDPGMTQMKRRLIQPGEQIRISPPTLLDIVATHLERYMMSPTRTTESQE